MPSAKELIAHNRTVEEIAECIGADWLVYQDLSAVVESINSSAKRDEDRIARFEDSIFTGDYITGTVNEDYLKSIERLRKNSRRAKAVVDVDDQQDCGISLED